MYNVISAREGPSPWLGVRMWPGESTGCCRGNTATTWWLPPGTTTWIRAGTSATPPDFKDSWPPHCVAGTPGAQQHPGLVFTKWDGLFLKGRNEAAYSGFEGTDEATGEPLENFLRKRGVTEVDVCGIAADYCVNATARDAALAGFETTVLIDIKVAVHPQSLQDIVKE